MWQALAVDHLRSGACPKPPIAAIGHVMPISRTPSAVLIDTLPDF